MTKPNKNVKYNPHVESCVSQYIFIRTVKQSMVQFSKALRDYCPSPNINTGSE